MNVITEITFLIAMSVASVLAYRQITKLDVNKNTLPLLDDLLLFVCIPAFFVDTIFGIVPAVQIGNGFTISLTTLQVKSSNYVLNFILIESLFFIFIFFLVNASFNTNPVYNRRLKTLQ